MTSSIDLQELAGAEVEKLRARQFLLMQELDGIDSRISALDALLLAYRGSAPTKQAVPKPDASTAPKLPKGGRVGPGTTTRPELDNFEMVSKALSTTTEGMTAVEIREWVRANLWAACPDGFAGSPPGMFGHGKLAKVGLKYFLPGTEPRQVVVEKTPPKTTSVSQAAASAHALTKLEPQVQAPQAARHTVRPEPPKPVQRHSGNGKRSFDYGGQEVFLETRWWRLANKLLMGMGKGYFPARTVVEAAFAGEKLPIDFIGWLKTERFGLNEALAPTGLMMVIEPAGVFLKRCDA